MSPSATLSISSSPGGHGRARDGHQANALPHQQRFVDRQGSLQLAADNGKQ